MAGEITLSWETFREQFIDPGLEAGLTLHDESRLRVFIAEGGGSLGLMFPRGASSPDLVSPLRKIGVRNAILGGETWLQVVTSDPALYREFFYFSLGVADLVSEGVPAGDAVSKALVSWKRLLQEASRLSENDEIGLIGELLLLSRLLEKLGSAALASWTAPGRAVGSSSAQDPHDFRLAGGEVEVKTTRSASRLHVIHGLRQLVASPGLELFVLSNQLGPAGMAEGFTLPELIARVRGKLVEPLNRSRFDDALNRRARYRDEDAHLYTDRYLLRAPMALVRVDASFPKLTPPILETAVEASLLIRITDVQYRVNLDGLGWEDGTAEFSSVIS